MLKLLQITLAALWLVLQSACTDVEQAEPLRIGFNPWPGYEFIYLAKVKGFYEANDIDVKLVELNALGDVRRAFKNNKLTGVLVGRGGCKYGCKYLYRKE